jgi:hypothetical protein
VQITVHADGVCDNGRDPAGFALTIDEGGPGPGSCIGSGTGFSVMVEAAGSIAVTTT